MKVLALCYHTMSKAKNMISHVISNTGLSKPERNYCTTRKELLAIVKATEYFYHYLYGKISVPNWSGFFNIAFKLKKFRL